MNRSLQKNITTIYVMGFFHSFMVVIPVFVPLLQAHGLSMAEVMQTQAVFALTIALCEVPSGYIADLWGRRNAVLLGAGLNSVGFGVLLGAEGFVDFILYECILGIGFSLISGADLALLYDSEVQLRKLDSSGAAGSGKSLSRLIAIEAAASGVAGVFASILLIWSLDLVLIVQACTGIIPLALGFLLVEVPREGSVNVSGPNHRDNARHIIGVLLFGKPVVLWTAFAIAVFGLLAVYVFWLYQKYWELQGIPLTSFGYLWAVFALAVSTAAHFTADLERWLGIRRLLCLITVLPLAGLLGMALGTGWTGVWFGLAIQLSRGVSMSLFYEALNRRVPGEFRATVNSLVSLGVRAVFIVTGPLLGFTLDRFGMAITLLLLALVFAPLMALVMVPLMLRIRREDQSVAAPLPQT